MKREDAKKLVANIVPTSDDVKSFETFQPLAGQMEEFQKSGVVVVTADSEVRVLDTANGKREVTELHLEPEGSEDVAPVKVILAYNSRNLYLPTGESLREIGEKNLDNAMSAMAAFTVTQVEKTGHYPMRRSVAAENLGYLPTKELTSAEWTTLRQAYTSSDANKEAAKSPAYDARDIFEIPKITISPVE